MDSVAGLVSAPVVGPRADGPAGALSMASGGGGQLRPSWLQRLAPKGCHVDRPVLFVHAATLAAAFGVWAYLDRGLWFFGDEWDFLTRRGLHGATFSIWAPHNEHWSVLPILLWRALFSTVHLSTYWPYLVPLLLAHVVVVHLLWRASLREGSDQWVATALALLLALFGSGAEDLAWAFQIGFVGSLMFGLLALEVAEAQSWGSSGGAGTTPAVRGTTPAERGTSPAARDVAVALLALAALMCSGVGVPMTIALGLVVFARYGWRRASRVLCLPVVAYLVWFALAGRKGLAATGDTLSLSVFLKMPTFVAANLSDMVGHASGWAAAGAVLAVVLALWVLFNLKRLYRGHPMALGGCLAAATFYMMAATGRDRISATLSPSRYAYVGFALLLPAVAIALSDLARTRVGSEARAKLARGLVVAVVLAGTAANLVAGASFVESRTVFVRGLEDQIVTSSVLLQAKVQLARAIDVYPVWSSGYAAGYLTPGELVRLYRQHLLARPALASMTRGQIRQDESWLDLASGKGPAYPGRFSLADSPDVPIAAVVPLPGGARAPWPSGPGRCALAVVADRSGRVRLVGAGGQHGGSLWLSLGNQGGRAYFALEYAWGAGHARPGGPVQGETVQVPAHGHIWLNDAVAAQGLLVSLPPGRAAELCSLARPQGGGPRAA